MGHAALPLRRFSSRGAFAPMRSVHSRKPIMSVPINRLTETFAVAPQLSPDDMPAVAAAGFKSVIINRPDHEGGPDQPTAAEVSQAALNAGLTVEYQPVISGGMTAADVSRFAELLDTLPGPILAYCRTGTRCTNLYVAAQQSARK
jgi:uncharacterized protein (TIGR01244 family)